LVVVLVLGCAALAAARMARQRRRYRHDGESIDPPLERQDRGAGPGWPSSTFGDCEPMTAASSPPVLLIDMTEELPHPLQPLLVYAVVVELVAVVCVIAVLVAR
jgi:hypothetical protein